MSRFEHPLVPLLAALIRAQEQEGTRAARLLHDEVGQILSAAGLQLDVLRMDVESGSPEIARRIMEIQEILEQAFEQVRALSYDLNPAAVGRAGLRTALEGLAGRYRERTSIPIHLAFDSSVRLPAERASRLYKIAECALDNAVKHSGCRQVELLVRAAEQGVALEVKDDGKGFRLHEVAARLSGVGLLLMQCYAEQSGADLTITSAPGKGTIVRAQYPLSGQVF